MRSSDMKTYLAGLCLAALLAGSSLAGGLLGCAGTG